METPRVYAALSPTDPYADLRIRGNHIGFRLTADKVEPRDGQEIFTITLLIPAKASFAIVELSGNTMLSIDSSLKSAIATVEMFEHGGKPSPVLMVTEYPFHRALPLHNYVQYAYLSVPGPTNRQQVTGSIQAQAMGQEADVDSTTKMAAVLHKHQPIMDSVPYVPMGKVVCGWTPCGVTLDNDVRGHWREEFAAHQAAVLAAAGYGPTDADRTN